jgi:hypothetical protein
VAVAAALLALGVARSAPRMHGATRNGSVDTWRIAISIVVELASLLGPTEVGEATLLRSRPDRERLRARQPNSQITFRGQRVGVWAQPSGALRGGAPVTLGGKIGSAAAGSGERAGDGLFGWVHLLCRLGYAVATLRAPSAERRAPSAERRAPSTERRAPSTEHRAPSTEHRAPSAEHRAPSTECRAPSAERRAPNAVPRPATGRAYAGGSQTARSRLPVSGSGSGHSPAGLPGQSPVDWWREDGVSGGRIG